MVKKIKIFSRRKDRPADDFLGTVCQKKISDIRGKIPDLETRIYRTIVQVEDRLNGRTNIYLTSEGDIEVRRCKRPSWDQQMNKILLLTIKAKVKKDQLTDWSINSIDTARENIYKNIRIGGF